MMTQSERRAAFRARSAEREAKAVQRIRLARIDELAPKLDDEHTRAIIERLAVEAIRAEPEIAQSKLPEAVVQLLVDLGLVAPVGGQPFHEPTEPTP